MSPLPPIILNNFHHEVTDTAVWVWQTFTLEPIGFCVRYFLQVDALPESAVVEINGHLITAPNNGHSLTIDVTHFVTLDENRLGFKFTKQPGAIGQIRLLPIPCDEL